MYLDNRYKRDNASQIAFEKEMELDARTETEELGNFSRQGPEKSVGAEDYSLLTKSPNREPINEDTGKYANYNIDSFCAEHHKVLINYRDILPDGNCMFYSLIKVDPRRLNIRQLKKELLGSSAIEGCTNFHETKIILRSKHEWRTSDVLYVYSRHFDINICVHYYQGGRDKEHMHFTVEHGAPYIHLRLENNHYTPYLPRFNIDQNSCASDAILSNEPSDINIDDSSTLSSREQHITDSDEQELHSNAADGSRVRQTNKRFHTEVSKLITIGTAPPAQILDETRESAQITEIHEENSIIPSGNSDALEPNNNEAESIRDTRDPSNNTDIEQNLHDIALRASTNQSFLERCLVARARPPREKPP